ncbi:hypothetical protein B0H13DRAFT_1855194 [Mycena leptocephala]|nr:hypothetical protein B0H13DRAFT_1855194 [Mycena leptocephala]
MGQGGPGKLHQGVVRKFGLLTAKIAENLRVPKYRRTGGCAIPAAPRHTYRSLNMDVPSFRHLFKSQSAHNVNIARNAEGEKYRGYYPRRTRTKMLAKRSPQTPHHFGAAQKPNQNSGRVERLSYTPRTECSRNIIKNFPMSQRVNGVNFLCRIASKQRDLDGVKIFYGRDRQSWKRAAVNFGNTKYTRRHAPRGLLEKTKPPDTDSVLQKSRWEVSEVHNSRWSQVPAGPHTE